MVNKIKIFLIFSAKISRMNYYIFIYVFIYYFNFIINGI